MRILLVTLLLSVGCTQATPTPATQPEAVVLDLMDRPADELDMEFNATDPALVERFRLQLEADLERRRLHLARQRAALEKQGREVRQQRAELKAGYLATLAGLEAAQPTLPASWSPRTSCSLAGETPQPVWDYRPSALRFD